MPRQCKYVGMLTGVKVWGSGRLRLLQRRRRITLQDELYDASVEKDIEDTDSMLDDEEYSVGPVNILSCSKCRRRYRNKEYLEIHVEKCDGKNACNSALNEAIGMFIDMLTTGEVHPYELGRKHPHLNDRTLKDNVLEGLRFEECWAIRIKNGTTLSENSVQDYMKYIKR